VIDEADSALPGSFEATNRVLVEGVIDPDDVEAGGASRQLEAGGCPEAMLQESHGFEKNIVVRQEDLPLRENRIEQPEGLFVPRISPVGEGVEGRCVDEDQRRFFGRYASMRASSCRSETGADFPWSERPTATNENCFRLAGRFLRFVENICERVSRTSEDMDRPVS
jgi:hypothetical protein